MTDQAKLIKQGLAECIGVFIFVFSGCACAASDGKEIFAIAMAFGLAIMVMAFTMGGVSGGHLNPAVSFAFLITNNMAIVDCAVYCVAQLVGAFLGAICARMILNADDANKFPLLVCTKPGHEVTPVQALVVEVVTTFSLVFTVFCVALDKGKKTDEMKTNPSTGRQVPVGDLEDRQNYAAIPIGFAVVMGILASGNVSGGSMNPARSFGPAVAGAIGKHEGDGLSDLWVYFFGPLLGGLLAGVTWKYAFSERHGALFGDDE